MAGPIAQAAANRISRPGVEKGVTGKELRWQQNRAFGPGAMSPYPYSKEPQRPPRQSPSGGKWGSGVYERGRPDHTGMSSGVYQHRGASLKQRQEKGSYV